MASILHLKRAETLLGVLEQYGGDFPWFHYKFEPTTAFDEIRSLFDRELELMETEDWDKWEESYQQIEALGLRLVEVTNGEEINDFLLHIQGHEAWFRY